MKKTISIILLVLALYSMLVLGGCNTATETSSTDPLGEIVDGIRVIEISSGFSKQSIFVNRGEELKIIYTGKSDEVSLSVPGYEASETSKNGTVTLYVKAKNVGEFVIDALDGSKSEIGSLVVKSFENEAVFKSVGPQEFEAAMTGDYFLLDVRTQEEYDEVNIDGATLISVYELESRLAEIEQYKETPVLVYCRSGNRSIVASQILIDNGFENVTDLSGGISAWLSYQAGK